MAEYGRQTKDKFVRKELKQLKERTLDRKHYMKIAQQTFNTFIRMRDAGLPCISCGTTAKVQYAAGHFYSVGAFPNLRFEELNVHSQCNVYCNQKLSGNLHNYRVNLPLRIGQESFDKLQSMKGQVKQYTIDDLKELIATYRAKIKQLKSK